MSRAGGGASGGFSGGRAYGTIGGGKVKSASTMEKSTRPTGTKGGARTTSDRPVTSRATSTANRKKSDSLDKVIKQIEKGNITPTRIMRGERKVTEKHMENKLKYRFKFGKDRWK